MRIFKEKSRKYKGKSYYKMKINIPKGLLEESGFKEGDELEGRAKKGEIRLRRK